MTANPLKLVSRPVSSLSARQWAELARLKGHQQAYDAWTRRAIELGE